MNQEMPNNGPTAEGNCIAPNLGSGGISFHQHFAGTCRPNIFIFQNPGQYAISMQAEVDNGTRLYAQPVRKRFLEETRAPGDSTAFVRPWVNLGKRVLETSPVPVFNSEDKSSKANSE